MKFMNMIGLLTILILISCGQNLPKNESSNTHEVELKIKLNIENKKNRGTGYTDSNGTNFNLRYIPIKVTNTNPDPIRIKFDFLKEHYNSKESNNDSIHVLILPKVFALDGIELTTKNQVLIDSMQIELRKYFGNGSNDPYQLNDVLQSNESTLVAIGIHYKSNQALPTPIPNELFIQSDMSNYEQCENLNSIEKTSKTELGLWLKLNFNQGRANESCLIIPCGQISYLSE